MKKKKNQKTKRVVTIISVLLLILIVVFVYSKAKSNKMKNEIEQSELSNGENIENIENNEHQTNNDAEIPEENEQQTNSNQENPVESEQGPVKEEPSKTDNTVISTEEKEIVSDPKALDVLVNKTRNLPDTYIPEDLVSLSDVPTVLKNPEINQLREPAYLALKDLFAAAKNDSGFELFARSGYRSYNTQDSLYKSYVSVSGQAAADTYSAKPGQSEHQTGLAMDITCAALNYQLSDTFADTDEGKWVKENAHKFGFIVRYPKGKEDITGYLYEPWHIRFLGVELATKVFESGLTYEEYLEQ
ncbi:MAG: D-alanyl-D-alanine carboxypeptidase family protein [Sedimentibacter sp.]